MDPRAAEEAEDAAEAARSAAFDLFLRGRLVNLEECLAAAVARGDAGAAEALLRLGVSPDAPARDPPLVTAAGLESLDAMRALLARGANTAARNAEGYTALARAARRGTAAAVALLLESGVDPDGGGARPPLVEAASRGDWPIAELLIRAGADPDLPGANGWTALSSAIIYGNNAFAVELVAAGASAGVPEAAAHGGRTPLMFAAREGDAAAGVVEAILGRYGGGGGSGAREELRALLEARSSDGATALVHACRAGCARAAAALLDAGADPAGDPGGPGPLSEAVVWYENVAELLLERGAPPSGLALVEASKRGLLKTVLALVGRGADPGWAGDDGCTALMWAASLRMHGVARALVGLGARARPGAADRNGRSALEYAAGSGAGGRAEEAAALCHAILDAGGCERERDGDRECDRDRDGDRDRDRASAALLLACRWAGLKGVALRLVDEFGADPSAPGPSGVTPLHAAIAADNAELAAELLNRGAGVAAEGAVRLLVDNLRRLKRAYEALVSALPHALALYT